MSTDVVMPQMGESIAEGTIVRWIKKVGDVVARDEPLFEISTDKVDAEIPSPAAGVVAEIRVKEGETVPVNSVVAIIGQADAKSSPTTDAATKPGPAPPKSPEPPTTVENAGADAQARPAQKPTPAPPAQSQTATRPAPTGQVPATEGIEERIRPRSSPLVRRIAEDRHVDISQITGTGIAGRVTKRDILDS